ncbi:MAG: hypothetical protein K0R72_29 [Clostridia bacterium]|jgi:predicted metal-dependent hydrolase|nr:hypothetical protein [Clostridia bacterium]
MNKEIIYVDGINIVIQRKKVKNINLRIGRDKTVKVSANNRIKINKIEEFVKSKKAWINEGLNKIENYIKNNEEDIEYITGSKLKIQNNEYKIILATDKKNRAIIQDDFIYLFTTDISDRNRKKKIIDKLLKSIAIQLFDNSLNEMLELVKPYSVNRPKLKIRKMRSRWGSCNKSKNIVTINYELVKFSKDCLNYVMLHELIHFLVSGHNKLFYSYLSDLMPDWKEKKKILNEKYLY